VPKKIPIGLIVPLLAHKPNLSKINFESNMGSFIKEMWAFLRSRKKLWLAPIIAIMVILGALLIFAQGSVMAPFIYTLF
jgi:hypothetical protein